jgi:phage baseplate assembly protein gpV
MNAASVFAALLDRIELLERAVEALSVGQNNLIREARVLSVDTDKKVAVVDAQGLESIEVPWVTQAGTVMDWEPPKRGQRMLLISPGGNVGRAVLMPGGYTDEATHPSNDGDGFGRIIGGTKIFGTATTYDIETGTLTVKAKIVFEGNMDLKGDFNSEGSMTNNGKDVGSSHTNGGMPVD